MRLLPRGKEGFEPPFCAARTRCSETLLTCPRPHRWLATNQDKTSGSFTLYGLHLSCVIIWLTASAVSQMLDRGTEPVAQTHWLGNFMGQLRTPGFEQRLKKPLRLCSLVPFLIHFLHTLPS